MKVHLPQTHMQTYRSCINLCLSIAIFGSVAPAVFAETAPTMNQPDNGFYEGPNPEWAAAHASDVRGTPEHRQYHRDAVKAHLLWHSQHSIEQGTVAFENMHRVFHRLQNMLHRQFHNAVVTP